MEVLAFIDIINAGYNNVDRLIEQVPGLWTQSWHALTTQGWQKNRG